MWLLYDAQCGQGFRQWVVLLKWVSVHTDKSHFWLYHASCQLCAASFCQPTGREEGWWYSSSSEYYFVGQYKNVLWRKKSRNKVKLWCKQWSSRYSRRGTPQPGCINLSLLLTSALLSQPSPLARIGASSYAISWYLLVLQHNSWPLQPNLHISQVFSCIPCSSLATGIVIAWDQ